MFFKISSKSKQWRCWGKLSPRPAVHSQLAWCLAREVWNWARGWVSECTGTGTRLRLRHGGNPAPARSPGSDVREHRRMSAPGASQHVCPVSVQVPAGYWTAQLASAPVDLFCLDTPGCGRQAGERKRPSCYTSLYIPRVSRPRPFLATYLQTHPLLANSPEPEPELTSNTRHRGQARHHVT